MILRGVDTYSCQDEESSSEYGIHVRIKVRMPTLAMGIHN